MKEVALLSGGKDSQTCLLTSGCKYALYCKTGIGVKENFDFVQRLCDKEGIHLYVYEPEPRFSYEEILRRYGFPKQGMHTGTMRWLKWFQIRRFAREHKDEDIIFLSGRRKKESHRRMTNKKLVPIETPEKHITIKSPLIDWSTPQVWEYLKSQNQSICPVYETLHLSGDCLCGCFSTDEEARLLRLFHPDMALYIKSLEQKYGGHWGNGISLTGAFAETRLEQYACYECATIRYQTTHNQSI